VNFPGSALAGDAQLLTAEAYAQVEKWDRSAAAYRKFLDYFPDHSQVAGAWFNMATALFNLGDYQRSLEAFRTVAKDYPESEYVESARENAEICSKRLGAGVVEEHPPVSGGEPDEQPGSGPPTEGGQQ
jgi:TolA-binding protein